MAKARFTVWKEVRLGLPWGRPVAHSSLSYSTTYASTAAIQPATLSSGDDMFVEIWTDGDAVVNWGATTILSATGSAAPFKSSPADVMTYVWAKYGDGFGAKSD